MPHHKHLSFTKHGICTEREPAGPARVADSRKAEESNKFPGVLAPVHLD